MAEYNSAKNLNIDFIEEYSTDVMTGDRDKKMYLYYQLVQSLKKAESVDIIVSFLMESGVKMLLGELENALKRGAGIRILTGNYLGITQPSALYLIKRKLGDRVDLRFYNDKERSFHPNQNYLLDAVAELKENNPFFVLDGHFCLLDREGTITRVPEQFFIDLNPEAIVLLTEKSEIIAKRRMARDGLKIDLERTDRFQEAEMTYAKEVADKLRVPLQISQGAEDLQSTMEFIKKRRWSV